MTTPTLTLVRCLGALCMLAALITVAGCADHRRAQPATDTSASTPAPPSLMATGPSHRDELDGLLDRALGEWSEEHDVVGAVALIRDGDLTVSAATGTRSISSPDPIQAGDAFATGSITKTVSAVVALQLADAGLLALDDAVAGSVPGVPEAITVRDLLGHTSGFNDSDIAGQLMDAVLQPRTRRTRTEQITDIVAAGPTGARGTHEYASVNYLLLDQVIAVASQSTFEEQVAEVVLESLDMHSSGFEPDVTDHASPHERTAPGQPPFDLAVFDTSGIIRSSGASGALFSTVEDLDAFIQAVFHGDVFADGTAGQLIDPIVPGADYGLGLSVYDSPSGTSYGHNGRTVGFTASIRHDPDRELTVIVLSNDGNAPTGELATTLLGTLRG